MTRTDTLIRALLGTLMTLAIVGGFVLALVMTSNRVHADASARCEAAFVTSGTITVGCLTYLDDAEEAGRVTGVTEALLD